VQANKKWRPQSGIEGFDDAVTCSKWTTSKYRGSFAV